MVRCFTNNRKVGFPLRETLGEGEKLAYDGKITPLLILFPKILKTLIICLKKTIIYVILLLSNIFRKEVRI